MDLQDEIRRRIPEDLKPLYRTLRRELSRNPPGGRDRVRYRDLLQLAELMRIAKWSEMANGLANLHEGYRHPVGAWVLDTTDTSVATGNVVFLRGYPYADEPASRIPAVAKFWQSVLPDESNIVVEYTSVTHAYMCEALRYSHNVWNTYFELVGRTVRRVSPCHSVAATIGAGIRTSFTLEKVVDGTADISAYVATDED